MKRYAMEIVGIMGGPESGTVKVEAVVKSPTGPYCLVEEVRPLLLECVRALRMAAALAVSPESFEREMAEDDFNSLEHEISAFLA